MTEQAFEEAASLLARRVGHRLDPSNRSRLTRAVRDAAREVGVDLLSYVAQLDRDPDALQDLLNRVTVQETSFFRDAGQFAALAEHVLPVLRAGALPVTIWSAGCANGQEPYSLAMTLVEAGIAQWRVLATDISTKALRRVSAARYSDTEVRGLSAERRSRFLVPAQGERGTWEIDGALRDHVIALRHNLAAEPPPFGSGECQVVFCRNVLIYFEHDDVVAFIDRVADRMTATGHLFLGYSESLWQVSDRFHLVRMGDAFVYRKGAPQPVRPARPTPPPTPPRPLVRMPPTVTRPPAPRPAPKPAPAPERAIVAEPSSVGLLAIGEAALGDGDHGAAIAAFRKAAYLDPDHPIAHLNLGFALEAGGDRPAATRAYAAARAALDRCDTALVEATLEGYHLDELTRLLDQKTEAS